MKKLIFLRNGHDDFNQIYEYRPIDVLPTTNYKDVWREGYYEIKSWLGIGSYLYDIDKLIEHKGYINAIEDIKVQMNIWYTTTCPTILSEHNKNFDPMWWNEEEHKWEIYFIENGKLRNISEYTDKELRAAHNIEKLYLNGGLDD